MDELDSGKKYSLEETLGILMTSPCVNDNLDISQDDPNEHVDDENGSMGHFDAQEATCEDLLQLNDICDEIISSNLIEEAKEMLQDVSDFKSIAHSDIVPGKDIRNCGGENDDEISVDDEGSYDEDVFEKEMDYIPDESDESDTSCMDEITKVVNIVSDTPSVHEYVTEHHESLEGNKTKQIRVRKDDKKIKRDRLKHPILPPCSCAKKCIEMIPENERKKIHSSFWSFSYNERKMFIYTKMSRKEVKRRKSTNKGLRKREMSFKYFLQGVGGIDIEICQSFFLKTLVFKSHKILQQFRKIILHLRRPIVINVEEIEGVVLKSEKTKCLYLI